MHEEGGLVTQNLIDVEVDVEEADRKKDEIGQKSAVFMILRRFATGKSWYPNERISRKSRPTNLIPIAEPSKEDLTITSAIYDQMQHG